MYKLKVCSVCGAAELVELGGELKNGEMFGVYQCPCCDSVLYAHEKYLREQKASSKALLKAISNMAKAESEATKKEEAEKNTTAPVSSTTTNNVATSPVHGTAQEVYKLTRGGAIKMNVDFGNRKITPEGIGISTYAGTGTMISNEYFITNAHVVIEQDKAEGTQKMPIDIICASDNDEYRFGAVLLYYDTRLDLALLKVDSESDKLVPVKFRETEVEVGEPVLAIGNAKGQGVCPLDGIVRDNHRPIGGLDYIMISAAITNGNSGGPVYDGRGELIGVVVSGYNDTPSMNYVIPVHTIKRFLKDAKLKGVIDRDF